MSGLLQALKLGSTEDMALKLGSTDNKGLELAGVLHIVGCGFP